MRWALGVLGFAHGTDGALDRRSHPAPVPRAGSATPTPTTAAPRGGAAERLSDLAEARRILLEIGREAGGAACSTPGRRVEPGQPVAGRHRGGGRPAAVARIDFPYRKEGRKAPDRAAEADRLRHRGGRPRWRPRPASRPTALVLGGRSMGGRMCSMAVAEGLPAAGLVLLCYPLHPPGKPENLRVEHFPQLEVPCLFVSGTKDPFGSPEELEAHAADHPRAGHRATGSRASGHDLKGNDDEIVATVTAGWPPGLSAARRPGPGAVLRVDRPPARGGRSRGMVTTISTAQQATGADGDAPRWRGRAPQRSEPASRRSSRPRPTPEHADTVRSGRWPGPGPWWGTARARRRRGRARRRRRRSRRRPTTPTGPAPARYMATVSGDAADQADGARPPAGPGRRPGGRRRRCRCMPGCSSAG